MAHHDSKMINFINEAIMNQKHLNLDIIPEEKMKTDKDEVKRVHVKKKAKVPFKKNAEPEKVKRNRGIRRR